MSRKEGFLLFVSVNVVCNYLWYNDVQTWRIFLHQAWAVFCAYGMHYWFNREVVS